ncbi:MAG: leucine-rich repeat domain-containing protein [Paludibacteraceae bacterium]|nr:leucine-rich repeat domain-containing protein [Paludibacteraceae bacterium]
MKKIFTFIAALTLSVGLFAEETILAIGPWEAQNWINQPTLLSDGGTELANIGAHAGDVINFYIEPTKEDWACQILEGHWGSTYALICAPSIASTLGYNAYDLSANGGKYALALTQEMIDAALTPQWWGGTFLINGDGVVVTKLTLVTSSAPIFVDEASGLTFRITDSGEVNNVMVIPAKSEYPTYSGDVVIPSTVNYHDTTFTVTQIGSNAFAGCSNLTSVTIPSSVTTIGYNAFYDCTGLISVTIPNSVTTIGDDAFYLVNNIVYNGTATGSPWGAKCVNGYVDGYLVYSDASKTILCGCSTAATGEIVIPNSVTTIGDKAFVGCSGLTSPVYNNSCFAYMPTSYQGAYTIPDGIKQIAGYAFFWCVSLTSVTIPNSVTTIGDYAFGYSGLTSINLPDSITTIGKGGFEYCDGLTSITIPNSVRTIDDYAFSYCKGLVSITIPDSVTTIGMMTFYVCTSLTSITIPASVTSIGKWAFNYCYSLTSIDIPNSVTTIGDYAFASCGLKDVSVNWTSSDQLPTMESEVFIGIANTEGPSAATLHVPEGTKSIYEAADQWKDFGTITDKQYDLKNNIITYTATEKLTNPYLEVGWTTFGPAIISHTFSNGTGTITCGGEITKIGDMAFAFSGLTSINIPNSVTTIEGMAFYNCASLTSITIPNSVTTIGDYAFYWCYALTSIDVDAANTHYCSIDGVLFNYAKDTLIQYPIGNTRTEYTVPNSVTTIEGSAFFSCSGLTSVTMPNSVATIGKRAFEDCPNLISITIPNLVTTIEELTFWGCSGLISIIIPNSVTTIGDGAFGNCSSLTTITCYAVTPPECGDDIFANVFEHISQDAKVYVPASSLTDYQNAEVWKDLQLYPIAADVTPMDDENPIVIPTDQDVTITWAITGGADTYTLTITKDGETVCVLTFNADGQLTNIVFAAPGHNGARQAPAATRTTQGFQFTVTGLDPGTAYEYSVTTTNAEGQTIAEQKGNFNTTGGTGFKSVHDSQCTMHKVLRNGQILLERNNATYTLMGQKVR